MYFSQQHHYAAEQWAVDFFVFEETFSPAARMTPAMPSAGASIREDQDVILAFFIYPNAVRLWNIFERWHPHEQKELSRQTLVPDMIYLCFPNNPTGAAITKDELQKWVDYANKNGAVIIYDAAYEAYITEEDVPHSIFECEGARTCAIELRSFSKNAGFTGVRLGATIIPKDLKSGDVMLHSLWASFCSCEDMECPCIRPQPIRLAW